MHSLFFGVAAASLATFAHAYTKPTVSTWGPLLTPDLSSPVTQGETYKVTWDPAGKDTDGVTVSLVLCKGPSTNCVTSDTAIVEGVPAAQKSYDWAVPKDLAPGTQSTDSGYGMLIIVDGTGEFQYSTQFSVLAGKGGSSGSSSSASPSPKPTSTNSGVVLPPPATYTGTAWITSTVNGTVTSDLITFETGGAVWTGYNSLTISPYTDAMTSTATATASPTVTASTLAAGTTARATGSSRTSGTTSAAGASASTFQGAAGRLSINAAGVIIAGAAAVLAM